MKFIEFFAGVGLINEGLRKDGWECIWANDISKDKLFTYKANFGDKQFYLGDIWDVVNNPLIIPNDAFLYTASFPCTDLSVAGERKGLAGNESGTLNAVLQLLRTKISGNRPILVMLENVKGFLTSHDGDDVAYTVRSLNNIGYVVDIVELDAAYFTPQSRPRVFLFAVERSIAKLTMTLKGEEQIFDQWWAEFDSNPELRTNKIRKIVNKYKNLKWGLFNIPKPPQRKTTLSDIVDSTISDNDKLWWNEERKDKLFNQMSDNHKNVLLKMTRNDFNSYGTVYRRMRVGQSRAELRTDGIAGCLRTPKGGSSKQIIIRAGFNSWAVRLLSPREYARLQGVRDDFFLPDNENMGYFAMGDAVCVPAIEFLSKNILLPVYKKYVDFNQK